MGEKFTCNLFQSEPQIHKNFATFKTFRLYVMHVHFLPHTHAHAHTHTHIHTHTHTHIHTHTYNPQTEHDVSVCQRAIDLLYAMCDHTNAQTIVEELLHYLEKADYSIRETLV